MVRARPRCATRTGSLCAAFQNTTCTIIGYERYYHAGVSTSCCWNALELRLSARQRGPDLRCHIRVVGFYQDFEPQPLSCTPRHRVCGSHRFVRVLQSPFAHPVGPIPDYAVHSTIHARLHIMQQASVRTEIGKFMRSTVLHWVCTPRVWQRRRPGGLAR